MTPIITQDGQQQTPATLTAAARKRADRLARISAEQMEAALAFLSLIDPEAFEIALNAAGPAADTLPDEEPVSVCKACGAPVGIFPEHGMAWQHYRGTGASTGVNEVYAPDHVAEVAWYLPGELPDLG